MRTKKELDKYKVSVIIPFYNRANKLQRAVKSVLKQTHQNFEIILVDDGSADNAKKLKKLVDSSDKIKLLKNSKNLGASSARNKGIKAATGDYIAFLDSDDEYVENKLEVCIAYMVEKKLKILHTSYKREGKKETIVHSGMFYGHCERKMMFRCEIATPTVMIDRKWLEKRGVLFDTTMQVGEDVCFWLELLKNNTYLGGIDEPLTIIYTNENSAAFSPEKNLVGMKHIIAFLLNDSYYSKFNDELAGIMYDFITIAEEAKIKKLEKEISLTLKNKSRLHKFWFFLKHEGIKSTIRRFLIKVFGIKREKV